MGRYVLKTQEMKMLLDLFYLLVQNSRKRPGEELFKKAIQVYEYYANDLDYELALFYVDIVIELFEEIEDWKSVSYYQKQKIFYITGGSYSRE